MHSGRTRLRGAASRTLGFAGEHIFRFPGKNVADTIELIVSEELQEEVDGLGEGRRKGVADAVVEVRADGALAAGPRIGRRGQDRAAEAQAAIDAGVEAERTNSHHDAL